MSLVGKKPDNKAKTHFYFENFGAKLEGSVSLKRTIQMLNVGHVPTKRCFIDKRAEQILIMIFLRIYFSCNIIYRNHFLDIFSNLY